MRTQKALWSPPYPNLKLILAIVATQLLAVLMCGGGWLVPALPWEIIGWVWVYNLLWMMVQDVVKVSLYRIAESGGAGAVPFVQTMRQPLHTHRGLHHHMPSSRVGVD